MNMNKKIIASAAMFALVAVYALPSFIGLAKAPEAQASMSDYYLKIEGVDGESTVKDHEKSIQVLGFSFGESRPTTAGGGMSTGKVVFQDMHITKMIDKATPLLFLACASNKTIPKMTLSVVKTGPDKTTTYMTYTFENVGCSSFTNSADPNPRFFRAQLKNGVVDVPSWESEEVRG